MAGDLRWAQSLDLGGHDEIALRESVDLVRPQRDLGLPPRQKNVGMMSLLLGDGADTIHKIERLLEIGEAELTLEVMLFHDIPLGNLIVKWFQLFAFQRRNASPARSAEFIGKLFSHRITPDC
jgi:hypothetical protein